MRHFNITTSPYEWVNPSLLQKSKSLKRNFETRNMKQHQAFVEIGSSVNVFFSSFFEIAPVNVFYIKYTKFLNSLLEIHFLASDFSSFFQRAVA